MVNWFKVLRKISQFVVLSWLVGVVSFGFGTTQLAYAEAASVPAKYIAADGSDLTAMALCLPKELSQPSLQRALSESGNDFLQKVFDTKESYGDYKIGQAETNYLECLQSKGFTSQVKR